MKLLLTSAGISNPSIKNALIDLLGKPIEESSALFIPTAIYAVPNGADIAAKVIRGTLGDPFCTLPWKSLGILELTALPSMEKHIWVSKLNKTDALLVGGGDCQYLTYWMKESGLAEILPALLEKLVYVGLSAGSMVLTRHGTTYGHHALPADSPKFLGLLNFGILPHLDMKDSPKNSFEHLEKVATTLPMTVFALDDESAIKVNGGTTEVISEGSWKEFLPRAKA